MTHRIIVPALVAIVAACGAQETGDRSIVPDEADAAPAEDTIETNEVDAGKPEDTLETWADALEARDWETARQVWGQNGEASGMAPEEFERAYEKYKTIEIDAEPGRQEGAAGTVYYEAQVTMSGELQNGDAYRMEGPVLLSRVNNVPGASMEDRMWHIESIDLRPVMIEE
ncbi:hypothetical protein WNY37_12700 [Henriciella sp. AS95]|uniref:hypothetical protein n=1 Tax=Henriciella sp. AS95 TaxID=3135782 RepID=UPI003176CF42